MSYHEQVDKMVDSASDSARSAIDGANSIASAANDKGSRMIETVARQTAGLANQVSSTLKNAGVDTDKFSEQARGQVADLQAVLIQTIKNRPVGALAVAAGLGLLLGLMTSR